ncbi:LLM class flavin-dependent oxidoreductase [Neptunomonas phycophila]|uniref:LLM class flavin-dependent oxidoreductase n=1 Tax=Neptunomonas phycophila TaxID=1572645 RepID=UPI00351737D3
MKFGLFFEMTTPRPWGRDSEKKKLEETLEQIVLGDKLGFDHVWMTEHHFMEEYCHASAPEVVLSAAAQATKNIRIGHGVRHAPPKYNHPVRTAEMAGTLDLVSNGRVDMGFGSSGSECELGGFNISNDQKHEMAYEAIEQIANMMAMEPYPGFKGKHFSMPARNIVPKPLQKPHPPFWLACSARPTILEAAKKGMGALCFSFLEASEAKEWIDEYYDLFKNECKPIGHTVNPNFSLFTGFGVHKDEDVAADRFLEGLRFFQWSLNHYYRGGAHKPGRVDLWESFKADHEELKRTENDQFVQRQIATSRSGIGSVDNVRNRLRSLRDAGVDEVSFIMQMGDNKHEHICESMELFAKEILPEFKDEHDALEANKQAELEPYIEMAFDRIGGRKETHVPDDEIEDMFAVNYIAKYSKEDGAFGTK